MLWSSADLSAEIEFVEHDPNLRVLIDLDGQELIACSKGFKTKEFQPFEKSDDFIRGFIQQIKTVKTQSDPEAVILHGEYVFSAPSNQNQITIADLRFQKLWYARIKLIDAHTLVEAIFVNQEKDFDLAPLNEKLERKRDCAT